MNFLHASPVQGFASAIRLRAGAIRKGRWMLTLMALGACSAAGAADHEWYLHTGGVSHHFQDTQATKHQWREEHPGLGLERRAADGEDWNLRWAGGIMQDSRNYWGGYAGAAYVRQWRWTGVAEAGLGVGAYSFYRSVNWSGKMAVVPGVLPTASVGLLDNQVGLNFIYVPRIKAYNQSMPAVLHAQMVVRFQ
jgi:Antimicrobial peptide resistance and lipid A acylation protein PagP